MIAVLFEQTHNPDEVRIVSEDAQIPLAHSGAGSGISRAERLIGALLAIQGIANVVIESDAITVTRSDAADAWVSLWPQIDHAVCAVA